MDYKIILVYFLIGVVLSSLFFIVVLLGMLVLTIFKKDPEDSYNYLKNITYGAFGGLIAAIFLETRGETSTSIFHWIPKILSTLVLILVFVLLGFAYLFLLKFIYRKINPKGLRKSPYKIEKFG